VIPLIIDRQPDYLRVGGASSILTMPLGDRRVIDVISTSLSGIADQAAVIVPTFAYDDTYEAAIRQSEFSDVQIIHHDPLGDWAADYETSDYVVFLDAAQWPSDSVDILGGVGAYARFAGATHVVAVGAPAELRQRERVEQDELGRVRRVQRYYARTAGTDAGAPSVLLTVAPARALIGVPLRSLGRVRSELAYRGVLTRDMPVPTDVLDLMHESGALALNDHALRRLHRGRRGSTNVVITGARTHIHPTARLVGPVVVQSDAIVEERAAIIGPTVVGAGARIGRGAIVAHSVVLQSVQVADNAWTRQVVIGAVRPPESDGSGAQADHDEPEDSMLALQLEPVQRDRRISAGVKRVMDLALAVFGLIVTSPVLLVIAILIKLDSPGRVFFSHRREGRDGKEFSCVKFRTMVEGAHRQQRGLYKFNEVDGPQFKMDRDPRETRLGRWLRARSLDELPQLFNVIRGEMSLVGPRPSPFRENQVCVPWRRARLSVRPGITGLWQLCRGNRASGDFHEWVYYDILYVRHRSLWLDFKILVGTVITLGGRRSLPLSWLIRDAEHDGARPTPVAA
jgi:lipopolysaccharide/colanic/teichoic acid biosynthesis glycosyltransferase